MAIKINDITITGDIYYNGDKVQKVYINDQLVWEAIPKNNITLTIYSRYLGYGVDQFRVVLTAEYPVAEDITVNVRYNSWGASITVKIYKNDRYGMTGWIEDYADMAEITGISPQSDSTYQYTYTPSGYVEESEPVFNCLITAEAISYWSSPTPIPENYTLTVESQYHVEHYVYAYFNLSSTLTSVRVALIGTKSKTQTEEGPGKNATKCEWVGITQPDPDETGYYYVKGPTTFRSIRVY